MGLTEVIRRLVSRFGDQPTSLVPVSPSTTLPESLARRKQLFDAYSIDVVLDVGANTGQYAHELRRKLEFKHRIISFEPLKDEYETLSGNAAHDPLWSTHNFALGDTSTRTVIHVAGNSYSSSLLDMLPAHAEAAPESKYVDDQSIEVKTLDSIFGDMCQSYREVYLKLDTQGFESRVLKGAQRSLPRIGTIQMEMSLIPLYRGEVLFDDLYQVMKDSGYTLVSIEPGFSDPRTGRLLQFDGIFRRA